MSLAQDVLQKIDGTVRVQGFDGTNEQTYTAGGAAKVDGSAVTQPVSAASLPLPTNAATEASLAAAAASLVSIDGGTPAALGQGTMAQSMKVVIASDQSTVPVSFGAPANAALTQLARSNTSAVALASNASRKGMIFVNDSGAVCYLAFAATATSSAYSVRLQANSVYESLLGGYTGVVSAIWGSNGAGNLVITEITT